MASTQQCGSETLLRCYLQGDMEASVDAAIEEHLQHCKRCQDRLERLAGTDHWWNEARSMLVDYGTIDDPFNDQDPATDQPATGIDSYLKHWIGPTDDPTKMGRVGSYEVIGVVGHGGAGVVLRAHDNRLNRPVAIKTLLPALAHNPIARRRFERESRAVAAITHQNVVPIYSVDVYKEHLYIAMYYVGGRSLQQRIDKEGPLRVAEIVRVASQTARALAAAHAQGIIHRDIKPANILLENNVDRVYVTDFGLARVADDVSTHSGMVTGTPQYMSPEQCYGQKVDYRTDLFSLGSVMYAMCTGRSPFRSDTLMGMLRKVCDSTPRQIRELNPDIPAWLEAAVEKLLSKDPGDRFENASQFAQLLEQEIEHLNNPALVPVPARDWMLVAPGRATSFLRPRKKLMIGSMFALMGVLILAIAQVGIENGGEKAQGNPPVFNVSVNEDGNKQYESVIERQFDLDADGQVSATDWEADISIRGGETQQTKVKIIRRISGNYSEDAAQAAFKKHVVTFEDTSEKLTIQGTHEAKGDTPEARQLPSVEVAYVLVVPGKADVQLRTSDGNIVAGNLQGETMIRTTDGNIELSNLSGESTAETEDGEVVASDCTGVLVIKSEDGDVMLLNCEGEITVSTEDGDVTMNNCGGNLVSESAEGRVRHKQCSGKIVALQKNKKTKGGIAGKLVNVQSDGSDGVDGYSIYLPSSYSPKSKPYPVMVYLQGGLGVGGDVDQVNGWGIPQMLRENRLSEDLEPYLKDTFIIVSPHIQEGQYYDHQDGFNRVFDEVMDRYNADRKRVYLTGLSRGGTGTWGIVSRTPGVFAAAAPIAGGIHGVDDYKPLAEIPIWISHNVGDNIFDYNATARAVETIEGLTNVEFYRIDSPIPSGDEYLNEPRVMISVDVDNHDAWSEIYNDSSIYKWMLKHSL